MSTRVYEFGPFQLDTTRRRLLREGRSLPLTPKALETLKLLVESSGRLVTKDELMERLWPDTFVEEGSLTRNISVLRKVLGDDPREHRYIVTVPGKGYEFVADVRQVPSEEVELTVMEHTRTRIAVTEEEEREDEGNERPAGDLAEGLAPRRVSGAVRPETLGRAALLWRRRASPWQVLMMVALAVTPLAALGVYRFSIRTRDDGISRQPARQVEVTPLTVTGDVAHGAISPDGRTFAYGEDAGPRGSGLFVRQTSSLTGTQIVSNRDGRFLGMTFTPDGDFLYYVFQEPGEAQGSLFRIPTLGGPSRKLARNLDGRVAFSPDGRSIVFPRRNLERRESLLILANSDASGESEIASVPSPEFFGAPSWSPDGEWIAAAAGHGEGGYNRYLVVVRTKDWTKRTFPLERWQWINDVAWLPDSAGLVLVGRPHPDATYQLWSLSFPEGTARPLTDDVQSYSSRLSLTADGNAVLVLRTRRVSTVWLLSAKDPSSAKRITFGTAGYRGDLSWTPEGLIVFESSTAGTYDLSVMNDDGTGRVDLLGDLRGKAIAVSPVASPDGRHVVFAFDLEGTRNLWRMDIDGGNPLRLTKGAGEDHPSFTPDGRWVIFTRLGDQRQTLWKVDSEGRGEVRLTEAITRLPTVSPDGRLIACLHQEEKPDALWKIALLPVEGGEPIRVFSEPVPAPIQIEWSPDGRFVTYVQHDGGVSNIWAQPVDGGPPFRLTGFDDETIFGFSWSRDGDRIACVRGTWERNLVLIRGFR